MLGLYGLIRKELYMQDKLPLKYCDVPNNPIIDKCFIYVDAINNTGSGHSNSATTWKNLMGGTNGTKIGSPSWTDDACILSKFPQGFRFMVNSPSSVTMEAVFEFSTNDNEHIGYVINCIETGGSGLHACNSAYASVYNGSTYSSSAVHSLPKNKKNYMAITIDSASKLISSYTDSPLDRKSVSMSNYVYNSTTSKRAPWAIGYNSYYQSPWYGSSNQNSEQFIGKVHSVRVHSRVLTPDEIRKNMLYERNRYNF